MTQRTCTIADCGKPNKARGMCGTHYQRWQRHGDAEYQPPTVAERLLAMTDKSGDCWNWTGYVAESGYGYMKVDKGAPVGAHRVSYEVHVGPIPDGLQLDHLCRNTRCVNPAHLEAVTPRVNTLRSTAPTAINAAKTHCIRGHELVGYNLYMRKDRPGRRQCRECNRQARRTGNAPGRPRKVA